MKTTRGTVRAACAALVASLWLAGCGPGVGGTGTDSVSDAFAAWGASPAPICDSALGAPLGCGATASLPQASSWVEVTGARAVLVVYVGDTVVVDDRCAGTRFEGLWGATGSGTGRYFGVFRAKGGEGQAAALKVSVPAAGQQRLELRDLQERMLLGPVDLSPAALPLPSPQCP